MSQERPCIPGEGEGEGEGAEESQEEDNQSLRGGSGSGFPWPRDGFAQPSFQDFPVQGDRFV